MELTVIFLLYQILIKIIINNNSFSNNNKCINNNNSNNSKIKLIKVWNAKMLWNFKADYLNPIKICKIKLLSYMKVIKELKN
jgi:hypothetical protein